MGIEGEGRFNDLFPRKTNFGFILRTVFGHPNSGPKLIYPKRRVPHFYCLLGTPPRGGDLLFCPSCFFWVGGTGFLPLFFSFLSAAKPTDQGEERVVLLVVVVVGGFGGTVLRSPMYKK